MREHGFRHLLAAALALLLLPVPYATSAQVTADTSDAAQAVLSRLERSAQGGPRSLQAGRDGLEKMRQSLKVDGKSY